jgi:uncharacterized membrane protein
VASRDRTAHRLIGLDVARCLALLGMVAAHVLDVRDPGGDVTVVHLLTAGRSAALFAVLAGVSLALITGRREPVRGRERLARSAGIAVRAVMVAAIGLWLEGIGSGVAVILTYYGVLFLLGLPFLGLRSRTLFTLAGACLVVAPVLSQWVRPDLPARGFDSPVLEAPYELASELLVTGYYPTLAWLAYLLAGLAVGRLDLADRRVAARLALVGTVIAVAAYAASWLLVSVGSVQRALLTGPPRPAADPDQLREVILEGGFGTTPTGGPWQWLLTVGPHTATPFDLAHTIGTALAVIGVCLVVVGALGERSQRAVAIAFGAGTMTLSLYTLHVVMRSPLLPPAEEPSSFPYHVVALLGIGAVYVAARRRGPLEWVVGLASSRTAAVVRRRPAREPEQVPSP